MLTALALLSALTATTPADRLAKYIVARQPKARPYARLLASEVIRQGRHHKIRPAVLLAIAWAESRFIRTVRGSAHEYGLWQLRADDYRLPKAWDRLRRAKLTKWYPDSPWRKLPARAQQRAMASIKVGAALAAAELAGVRAWCRKAGHRVGRGSPRWVKGRDGVHRLTAHRHRHWIDRFGHHQTGPRWPLRYYVRMLRREYKRISRAMKPQ